MSGLEIEFKNHSPPATTELQCRMDFQSKGHSYYLLDLNRALWVVF